MDLVEEIEDSSSILRNIRSPPEETTLEDENKTPPDQRNLT